MTRTNKNASKRDYRVQSSFIGHLARPHSRCLLHLPYLLLAVEHLVPPVLSPSLIEKLDKRAIRSFKRRCRRSWDERHRRHRYDGSTRDR